MVHSLSSSLARTPLTPAQLNLFFSDLVQALGAVMDIRWIHNGVVKTGGFCTAQGVIQQLGEASVAMTTLAITLATFIGVWCGKLASPRVATGVVACIWIYNIIMTSVGSGLYDEGSDPYVVPTPVRALFFRDLYLAERVYSTGAGSATSTSDSGSLASISGSGSLSAPPSSSISPSTFGAAAISVSMTPVGGASASMPSRTTRKPTRPDAGSRPSS